MIFTRRFRILRKRDSDAIVVLYVDSAIYGLVIVFINVCWFCWDIYRRPHCVTE